MAGQAKRQRTAGDRQADHAIDRFKAAAARLEKTAPGAGEPLKVTVAAAVNRVVREFGERLAAGSAKFPAVDPRGKTDR
jgi:hypothetical protein